MSQVDITGVQHYTVAIGHPNTPQQVGGAFPLMIDEATGQIDDPAAQAAVRGSVSVASSLVAMYETQRQADSMFGPMLLARTGYPVSADIPSITAAAGDPASDADASAQVIWPFHEDAPPGDEFTATQRARNSFVRGHSPNLRLRGWGNSIRAASRCVGYNQNGNQDQDLSNGYGIDRPIAVIDMTIDSDVLFMRGQADSSSIYEIYVNGNLVTAAAGTNMTLVNSRSYQPGAVWTKLKWGTVARRRVMIVCTASQMPREFRTRQTSTVMPTITNPIKWAHFGDSFSQYSGATVPTIGCTSWLHAAFGYNTHFLDASCGSTGIVKSDNNGVGQTPVVGQKPNFRLQWRLAVQGGFVPDIVTFLAGHNDTSSTALTTELATMFREIRESAPKAIIIPVAANTSPNLIASGADLSVENAIVAAADGIEGVYPVRLQGRPEGRFLRGSSGNSSAPAGLGNVDRYTGSDNVHPTDAGHRAYGQDAMALGVYNVLKSLS